MNEVVRRLALNLLDQFDPSEAKKHSFLDYHARGFDYLNLHRSDGLTVKLYMSRPEDLGESEYLVAPHDHMYNFHTHVIGGSVRHWMFDPRIRESNSDERYRLFHYDWRRRRFARHGAFVYEMSGIVNTFFRGDGYYLRHDQVHTIGLDRVRPTCLLLLQYADQPGKNWTRLFSESEKPPSMKGLYRRPNAAQVKRLAERAREFV